MKVIRFKKGRSLKYIEEHDAFHNPFETFEKFCVIEVRKMCLENMQTKRVQIFGWHVDWAEEAILNLFAQKDEMWEEVLSWYLFGVDEELLIRAIDFSVDLAEKDTLYSDRLLKHIAGRMTREHSLEKIPESLKSFLCRTMNYFFRHEHNGNSWLNGVKKNNNYLEHNWIRIERCLRIIIYFGDYSFLYKVDELINVLEEGIAWPCQGSSFDAKDRNVASLKAAYRILLNEWLTAVGEGIDKFEQVSEHSDYSSMRLTYQELLQIKKEYVK